MNNLLFGYRLNLRNNNMVRILIELLHTQIRHQLGFYYTG